MENLLLLVLFGSVIYAVLWVAIEGSEKLGTVMTRRKNSR
jgi:hypothetical protein